MVKLLAQGLASSMWQSMTSSLDLNLNCIIFCIIKHCYQHKEKYFYLFICETDTKIKIFFKFIIEFKTIKYMIIVQKIVFKVLSMLFLKNGSLITTHKPSSWKLSQNFLCILPKSCYAFENTEIWDLSYC